MAYRLNTRPLFWSTVTVQLGEEQPQTFRAQFRALEADEYNAFDLSTPEGTAAFIKETLQDVADIEDADGKAIAFGPQLLASLNATPHVRLSLVRAYQAAFQKASSGN